MGWDEDIMTLLTLFVIFIKRFYRKNSICRVGCHLQTNYNAVTERASHKKATFTHFVQPAVTGSRWVADVNKRKTVLQR